MKPHTANAFTEELRKIASLRLRAAEAGIGGLVGAGAGALSDDEDRKAGATRGALVGAGGAAVLSSVMRTLLANRQIARALPKALEEGEAALQPRVAVLREARARAEAAAGRAPKHEVKPLPRHADVVRELAENKFPPAYADYRFAIARKALEGARKDQGEAVGSELSHLRSLYRGDIADHRASLDVEQDPAMRKRLFKNLRDMYEGLEADLEAVRSGAVGPRAAGAPERTSVEKAEQGVEAAKEFGGRMRELVARRQRAAHVLDNRARQWASKEELARSEAALAAAKADLDAARTTHGREAVRKRVVDEAYAERNKKLFGVA